tara:strand:+ start:5468 stop:11656 length:6189 start_codon:yes stop_codon:yes gene_type:complete
MGFIDRLKDIGGGILDIGEGSLDFAVDTVKSSAYLISMQPDKAAETWFNSWQEDILGTAMQGAFGPEGVIGSIVGALPESGPLGFIRTGGGKYFNTAMEGWDWLMQSVVDDGLGTFATVVGASLSDGNISRMWDGSTWAKAYDINSKSYDENGNRIEGHGRTFGQSMLAATMMIDPFDDEAMNAVQDDYMFKLFSGMLDFAQEFLDPVDIALGGTANVLSGKTAIGRVTKTGDVKIVGVKKVVDPLTGKEVLTSTLGRRHVSPQRIYTPGGGLGWRRMDKLLEGELVTSSRFKGLTEEQRKIRRMIGTTSTQARAHAFVNSSKYKLIEDELGKVDTLVENGKLTVEEGARRRGVVLRETIGRRAAAPEAMPEAAAFAIAHGATPEARRLTARALIGDMTAFDEAKSIAVGARKLLEDGSYFDDLDMIDDLNSRIEVLDQKIASYGKAEDLTGGRKGARTRFVNQKKRLEDELKPYEQRRAIAEKDLDSVDFEMMFDLQKGLQESQITQIVNGSTNVRRSTLTDEMLTADDGLRATAEFTLERLAVMDLLDDPIYFKGLNKQISKVYRTNSLQALRNKHLRKLNERAKAGDDLGRYQKRNADFIERVYQIPSVITPFGFRTMRVLTQRVPQALIEFNDAGAFTQYERMLSNASEMTIGGKTVIDADEVRDLLGRWMEIRNRADSNMVADLRAEFDRTTNNLVNKTDKLIVDAGIDIGESLAVQLQTANNIKNSAQKGQARKQGAQTPKKVGSIRSSEKAYSSYILDNETVFINHGMSPHMVQQAAVIPRFDLINNFIKDADRKVVLTKKQLDDNLSQAQTKLDELTANKANAKKIEAATKAVEDAKEAVNNFSPEQYARDLSVKRWVQTKDGFKRVAKPLRNRAQQAQNIWRPMVLLTPKWPMRVQLDETLRRLADLGAITEMRNVFRGMNNLKDAYATRSIESSMRDVTTTIKQDALDAIENGNLTQTANETVTSLFSDAKIKTLKNGELRFLDESLEKPRYITAEKFLERKINANDVTAYEVMNVVEGGADILQSRIKETAQRAKQENRLRYAMPTISRAFIAGSLLNPLAGAAWAGMHGISRHRRINNIAGKRAALHQSSLYMSEAKRLLDDAFEAAGDEAIGMRIYAEQMMQQGVSIRTLVDKLDKDMVGLDDVVNSVEKAERLLVEAGHYNLKIGGITARGAFGDDADFIAMNQRAVSSTKAQSAMFLGFKQASERRLQEFNNAEWRAWDVLQEGTDPTFFAKGWNTMMERYTAIGDKWQSSFFDIVWADLPRDVRVARLVKELKTNEALSNNLGVYYPVEKAQQAGADVNRLYEDIADNIIDEYDNVLPRGQIFDELREKARTQKPVKWSDVKQALENFSIKSKKYADGDINAVIKDLRQGGMPRNALEGNRYEDFGRQVSPTPESIAPQRAGFGKESSKFIERIYENLGTLPADHLSRNPYYRTKYERAFYDKISQYMDADGQVTISPKQLRKLEDEARDVALLETRNLLYDLAEETRFGEMAALIMPFYNAWQEVIGRWVKLGQENPAVVAKGVRLYMSDWNAETLGITEINDEETGANYLAFRLPEWAVDGLDKLPADGGPLGLITKGPLGQLLSNNPIRFSKEGLASMLQSTTPGFGPLVSIPVREAILKSPELDETFDFMFPFGHPEGGFLERVKSGFIPAYQQNIDNLVRETPTRERQVQAFALQIFVEQAQNGTPIDITDEKQLNMLIDEANNRANDFFKFRIATGLLVPTSTTAFSPFDDLIKEARNLQREHGTLAGNQIFLEEHGPELFALTARMTRLNDGVAASATAEIAYIENQELVQAHPEVGGWVTGSLGAGDEEFKFSSAAYRRQTQMDISPSDDTKRRERKNVYDTIADTEVERGWGLYSVYADIVRSEQEKRRAAGLDYSMASTEMLPVKIMFDQLVDRLKNEIPAWGEEYATKSRVSKTPAIIEGFLAGLEQENILARPSTRHVIEYFQLRNFVEQKLIERSTTRNPETGRVGSDKLTAASNADLKLMWENQKEALAARPEFSRIYDRYFEQDMITTESFISTLRPDVWRAFTNGDIVNG